MSYGNWENLDGLNLQYGTQKTFPEDGGDYKSYGQTREIEFTVPLAALTTSSTSYFPVSMNIQMPTGSNIMVEKVEVFAEQSTTGSASATLNIGIGYFSSSVTSYNTFTSVSVVGGAAGSSYTVSYPQVTSISANCFLSGFPVNSLTTQGQLTTLLTGSTGAGVFVGTSVPSQTTDTYIIAGATTNTFSSGVARVRIFYRGFGSISN